MLKPFFSKQFERDLALMRRRGKEGKKIREILQKLIHEEKLEPRFRDHKLTGNFKDRRECHIEPDWLLVYRVQEGTIVFERTGTHADLFK
jgi:mRNA interferase YafQ